MRHITLCAPLQGCPPPDPATPPVRSIKRCPQKALNLGPPPGPNDRHSLTARLPQTLLHPRGTGEGPCCPSNPLRLLKLSPSVSPLCTTFTLSIAQRKQRKTEENSCACALGQGRLTAGLHAIKLKTIATVIHQSGLPASFETGKSDKLHRNKDNEQTHTHTHGSVLLY